MRCNNFPWYPLTPSVYYTGMSYYEDLCKLAGYLNDIVKTLESYDIEGIQSDIALLKEQQKAIDGQIANLQQQVGGVMTQVNNALDLYNKQVQASLAETTANLTTFVSSQLLTLRKYIDGQDAAIYSEIRYQIELLKNSLPDLTTVLVVSPYTGQLVTIQQAIDELWDNLRVYALTADEYDSQQWTAEEYDNFKLTAFEYDYFAKEYIYEDPRFYMFSPWTGERVFYQEVIMALVGLHRTNALTASEYDALGLTASTYDGKSVTAYTYDWNGYSALTGQQPIVSGNVVLDPDNDGLTAYEQSKLAIKN